MKLTKEQRLKMFNEFNIVVSHFELLNDLKEDAVDSKIDHKTILKFYKWSKVSSFDIAVDVIEWFIKDGLSVASVCEFSYYSLVEGIIRDVVWFLDDQSYEKQSIIVSGEKITLGELKNAMRLLEFGFTPKITNIEDFMSFIQKNAFEYILDLKNHKINNDNYAIIIHNLLSTKFCVKGVVASFHEKIKSGTSDEIKALATQYIQNLKITDIKVKFWLACLESGFDLGKVVLRLDYLLQDVHRANDVKKLLKDTFWSNQPLTKDEEKNMLDKFVNDKNLPLYLCVVGDNERVIADNIRLENYNAVEFHNLMSRIGWLGCRDKEFRDNLINLASKGELFKFITLYYFDAKGVLTVDIFKDMVSGMPENFYTTSQHVDNLINSLNIIQSVFDYPQDICLTLIDKSKVWLNSENKEIRRLGAYVLRNCLYYMR